MSRRSLPTSRRPLVPARAARRGAAAWALAAAGVACRHPATAVRVELDTDVPAERAMELRVEVQYANGITAPVQDWTRGGAGDAAGAITLPGSFAVVPGRAPRDATVTVVITANVAAAGLDAPALSFRRRARFGFTERTTTRVPIFLPISCGLASTGCTSVPDAQCTASIRCEDLGATCGDDATCVPIDVDPLPDLPDGGAPDARGDGGRRDGSGGGGGDAVAGDARGDGAGPAGAARDGAGTGDGGAGYVLVPMMTSSTPLRGGLGAAVPDVLCNASPATEIGVVNGADVYSMAWIEGATLHCGAIFSSGSIVPSMPSALTGDGTGTMDSDSCATGSAVVGLHGTQSGGYVTSVGLLCAPLTTWTMGTAGTPTSLPVRGAGSGTAFNDVCPAAYVVTGMHFLVQSGTINSMQAICTQVVRR